MEQVDLRRNLIQKPRPLGGPGAVAKALNIPLAELEALASHVQDYPLSHYKLLTLRDNRKDKNRPVVSPHRKLKHVQKKIARHILTRVNLPSSMLGGVPGKSILDNAGRHLGRVEVAQFDLKACFPNTTTRMVREVYQHLLFCDPKAALMLCKLTTLFGSVPQGAPSSTALVNLSLLPLHASLFKIAEESGLSLSMWIDDMALSGAGAGKALAPAIKSAVRHGRPVRAKKVELQPRNLRQTITGTVVNKGSGPTISKTDRKAIRNEILRVASASEVSEREVASLSGRIEHVARVNPCQGAKLSQFFEQRRPSTVNGGEGTPRFEVFARTLGNEVPVGGDSRTRPIISWQTVKKELGRFS